MPLPLVAAMVALVPANAILGAAVASLIAIDLLLTVVSAATWRREEVMARR